MNYALKVVLLDGIVSRQEVVCAGEETERAVRLAAEFDGNADFASVHFAR